MAHLDEQSQSLQVPLDLVQLELKIELERLKRIEIFCNGYCHWQCHIHSPQLRTGGLRQYSNKAGYTATPVTCGWAGAVKEKVTWAFGQEELAQKTQKRQKNKKGTNQPTHRWMDKQNRVELHSTQLKDCSKFKKVSNNQTDGQTDKPIKQIQELCVRH